MLDLPALYTEKYGPDGALVSRTPNFTLQEWKPLVIAHIKAWGGRILANTDWQVVKQAETLQPMPEEVASSRSMVRGIVDAAESAIMDATTLEEADAVAWAQALAPHDVQQEKLGLQP